MVKIANNYGGNVNKEIINVILTDFKYMLICLFVCLFERAPDIPEMSVPGVGFSFKPKGLAFVTPLYPV